MASSSSESLESADEFLFRDVYSASPDLSLDEYNDEDLSEIAEEKSLKCSLVNGRYKKQKVKLSSRQISEHMKKISPDMIQLELTEGVRTNSEIDVDSRFVKCNGRPQTLNLFSQMKSSTETRDGHHLSNSTVPGKKEQATEEHLARCDKKKCFRHDDVNDKTVTAKRKDRVRCNKEQELEQIDHFLSRSASEWSIEDPESVEYCYLDGEMKKQTHIATFKFVPRHADEMFLDIYDPIHIETQYDDLWFEGLNMRTGEKGIFPSYYAQSAPNYLEEYTADDDNDWEEFFMYFIGSVEVPCHKGHDVLCHAMYKVADVRRQTINCSPPAYVCLMVGTRGVKMIDQSALKQYNNRKPKSSGRCFSSSCKVRMSRAIRPYSRPKVKRRTHFFQMKNISFCGHHPRNEKYFGFITRHPTQYRFACHTFVCSSSTRAVIDSFGSAFSQYLQDYMEFVQPSGDIYLE